MDNKEKTEVVAALSVLHQSSGPFEIRAPNTKKGVQSGYFDDIEAARQAIIELDGEVPGIFVTLNAINPDLLARADNKIKPYAKNTTADGDVTRRRWLVLDLDPIRPAGISAIQMEKDAAHSAAIECRDWLSGFGWPEPFFCDSGNGYHLLYQVDLPNDPASRELIEGCLQAVAFRIDTQQVSVDQTMGNAARIIKVYGTMCCKGDSTPDRPHRRAKIIETPYPCEIVPPDQLTALRQTRPSVPARPAQANSPLMGKFNIDQFIKESGLVITKLGPWQGGRRWVLAACPFNAAHTDRSAFIVELASGALQAGCHHNSCKDKDWDALRRIYGSAKSDTDSGRIDSGKDQAGDTTPSRFVVQDGAIYYVKPPGPRDNSPTPVRLCNFSAKVIDEVLADDGVTEASRLFTIELKLTNGAVKIIPDLSASEFINMHWPIEYGGVTACVVSGHRHTDLLREAIQTLSGEVPERRLFAHVGWRKVDGVWVFLHAGRTDLSVNLPPPLNRYALPLDVPDPLIGIGTSLALIDVCDRKVSLALLAFTYLAPLCEFLSPDFMVYLVGPTGSMKSELSGVFQAHYGPFDRKQLPGSWESTPNALEKQLSDAKDVLTVIDDYAPRSDQGAQSQLNRTAQRIIRGVGNQSGRGRLASNLKHRPTYTPRGLLLTSGEDLPPGQSIVARMLTIPLERDAVDLPTLSRAQASLGVLPEAMATYLSWLQPQLDDLPDQLKIRFIAHRSLFQNATHHLRMAEILAYLYLGTELMLEFFQTYGALTDAEAENLKQESVAAFNELGNQHRLRLAESDPAETYMTTIATLLAQDRCYIANSNRTEPSQGLIGWTDGSYYYLLPDAARTAVTAYLREGGIHFATTAHGLNGALKARGVLIPGPGNRLTVLKTLGGRRRRVMQILVSAFDAQDEMGPDAEDDEPLSWLADLS